MAAALQVNDLGQQANAIGTLSILIHKLKTQPKHSAIILSTLSSLVRDNLVPKSQREGFTHLVAGRYESQLIHAIGLHTAVQGEIAINRSNSAFVRENLVVNLGAGTNEIYAISPTYDQGNIDPITQAKSLARIDSILHDYDNAKIAGVVTNVLFRSEEGRATLTKIKRQIISLVTRESVETFNAAEKKSLQELGIVGQDDKIASAFVPIFDRTLRIERAGIMTSLPKIPDQIPDSLSLWIIKNDPQVKAIRDSIPDPDASSE